MTPVGIARPCPPFAKGVDCLSPVSEALAVLLYTDDHCTYVGRYLNGPTPLTARERDAIFSAGLAIWPLLVAVTHEPLTAAGGTAYGDHAVSLAAAVAMPRRVHVCQDYEDSMPGGDDLGFIDGCGDRLLVGGLGSMLYVGLPERLSGPQLYHAVPNRYACCPDPVPYPAPRGFSLVQLAPLDAMLHGHRFDVSFVRADAEGDTPIMWWPA